MTSEPPAPHDDHTVYAAGADAGPLDSRAPIERGDQIGRYTVLEMLGAGGMGVVFTAYDPELDRKVAIKLIRHRRRAAADLDVDAGRLLREAQALAKLSHPNVVVVHDVGAHRGAVWVAMEYVDGGTLHDWLGERRTWREVLALFRDAGRGLVAAHAAGIVHRDFKPANVLIGANGRVLVADFGLARQADDAPEHESLQAAREITGSRAAISADRKSTTGRTSAIAAAIGVAAGSGGSSRFESDSDRGPRRVKPGPSASFASLSARLTETGALMGTPAYMSPEQIAGEVAGERSDQFSFCVAMYEALYGERPFAGESLAAIAFAAEQGKIRDAPRDTDVPRWLRRAVVRGLAPRTSDRHPSMAALLRAMDRGPQRRRVAVGAAIGSAAIAGAFAFAATRDASPHLCEGAAERMDDVYSAATRDAVRRSVSADGSDHATRTADRVVERLDAFRNDWEAMYVDACEATHVRGEQSAELLDRRMACLQRRRRQLGSVAEVLVSADEDFTNRALKTVGTLSTIGACGDRETLLQTVPLPEDEALRERIAHLESEVDAVHVLRRAVHLDDAKALVDPLLDAARETDHAPLVAEAMEATGALAGEMDDEDESIRWLEEAYTTALGSGADRVAARSAQRLIAAYENTAKYDDAEHWTRLALATASRIGSPDDVLGAIYTNVGNLRAAQGRPRDAIEAHTTAREHYVRVMGADHERVADTLYNASSSLFSLGEIAEASAMVRRAVTIWEARLGPDHPRTISGHTAYAMFEWQRGNLGDAVTQMKVALARREEVYGKNHTNVAQTLMNLGAMQREAGAAEEARASLERALAIRTKASGPDHPATAAIAGNLAMALLDSGDLDGALEHAQTPVRVLVTDPPTFESAIAFSIRGEVLLRRGEFDAARADIERALAIRRAGESGEDSRELLGLLALLEAQAGDEVAARATMTRAREAGEGLDAGTNVERGTTRERFARALWALGDREEARRVARAAREDFSAGEFEQHVARMDEWLSRH